MTRTPTLVFLGFLAALGAPVCGQEIGPVPVPDDADTEVLEPVRSLRGHLRFDTLEHDFGPILDHEPVSTTFGFVNDGQSSITIHEIKSACGCTVPTLEKRTYEPDERGTITVQFNPEHRTGLQRRELKVMANEQLDGVATLAVNAHVRPLMVVHPFVIRFEPVEKGVSSTQQLILAGRPSDFAILRASMESLSRMFDVKIGDLEPTKIGGEAFQRARMEITFRADAPVGRHSDQLVIHTTESRRPMTEVPVMAEVLGDLALAPAAISLGRIAPGSSFSNEITLTSRTGTPFRVLGIEFRDGPEGAVVEFAPINPKNPNAYKISVSGRLPDSTDLIQAALVITTDVKEEPPVEAPFYGWPSLPGGQE